MIRLPASRIAGTARFCVSSPIRRWLFSKPSQNSTSEILSDPITITASNDLQKITQQNPQDIMHMMATESPDELDQILGKGVVRATRVEAVVRMMADMFMFYDDLDVNYLDKELDFEFGQGEHDSVSLEEDSGSNSPEETAWQVQSNSDPSKSSSASTLNHNSQKYGEDILSFLSDKSLSTPLNKPDEQSTADSQFEYNFFSSLWEKPRDKHTIYKSGRKNSPRPSKESLENYMELQAGSNAIRYSAKNSNGASKSLIEYMRNYRPDLLKGVSQQLLTTEGMPNLRTFHYLIRQLTLYQYTKPAQLALECLYLSEIPLSIQTWSIGISVAIANGSVYEFLRLARLLNLKPLANESLQLNAQGKLEQISSYPPQPWLASQPGDEEFGRKFFDSLSKNDSSSSSAANFEQQLAQHLSGTVEGFSRFGLYSHIDTIMRFFKKNALELNVPILTILMKCAYHTDDNVRAQWTWREMMQLVDTNGLKILDRTALDTARNTFSRLEDKQTLAQVEHYISKLGNAEQRLYRKSATPLNRMSDSG